MAQCTPGSGWLSGALLVAWLAAGSGCSRGPEGAPPRFVRLSAERAGELAAAVADPADATASGDAAAGAGRLPTTEIGPEAFANAAMVDGFVATCRAEQAAAKDVDPAPAEDGDALLAGYGSIYRGTRPKALAEMPADNVFRWVEGNPEYLDPNKISEASGTAIASQMFETLLALAPGNTPPRPGQAERFDVSPDGLTYTFHLRPGLVWSDGTPITAETFRRSWLRGLDPATASTNAVQLWYIAGAEAYNTGASTDPAAVGVRALDDLTLEVRLTAPTPFFPDLVTYIAYAPVPLHVVEAHGVRWTRVEHIVTNGPFTMTEWSPRSRVVLKKNPRYWDAANVALDGSVIHISDSESRNVLLYDTGQAHYINPIPLTLIRDGISDGRDDLHVDQQMCTYYYVFNMRRAPFDDRRVRLAFDAGVDKLGLTRDVLSAFQPPATSLLPDMYRSTLGYTSVPGPLHDLELARDELAAAGYPGGRGLPMVGLVYNTFEGHKLIAEFIERDLRAGLGVELDVRNMEWKSLLKQVLAGDFQLARTSWCADYPDPLTFLSVFIGDSPNNYSGYVNPAYDGLIERIRRETDRTERNALLCAAEKALNRDLPMLPLYFYTRAYLLRPEVRGFLPQYANRHYLKWVSLAGEGQE
ncbi:MAG: peptide ABC transporter substrate-binding protein [Deltaproteobacteria bacterium]|nr:MAG: peptide ABC transporter substrate-binding protein [Deltaproteobacteria bacterium]